MKQILQNVRSGEISVEAVPAPTLQPGRVLVRTAASLISAGTERTAVEDAKKGLITRAKERPDAVKKVLDRVKNEGIAAAYSAVKAKLDSCVALGYSASGVVTAVAPDISDIKPGDRVACAGTGYASHAEVISVPRNLCVRLPERVDFDEGAFGTLGAIALQGVRVAAPTLGDYVVVIGLGLLGQIAVQLLRANGCRVFGVDLDESKFDLALKSGADNCAVPPDARAAVDTWSRGRGADAVIITADTPSNEPIELAGQISRIKGRVVVIGLVGMDVPRADYFKKEINLTISMSYGPGRYDVEYEERGHDYPFSYVRWTERRNIEAFLDLIARGSVDVKRLVTHRFAIDDGREAYAIISREKKQPYVAVLLEYDRNDGMGLLSPRVYSQTRRGSLRVGVIGAGDYARAMLLPHFKNEKAEFVAVASASGVTAKNIAAQFHFTEAVSGADEIITNGTVDTVLLATRHDTHAAYATAALKAGKHVFVEKPLALNEAELDDVVAAAETSVGTLSVGFNRRFSPATRAAKDFFRVARPLSIVYRVNAGRISREHWIHDPVQGGGRIIGEVCHFVDLMHYLTGSLTARVYAESITTQNASVTEDDSVLVTLKFENGAIGTIAYLAEGDKALPKERIEIFGDGRSFVIDDFRETRAYSGGKEIIQKLDRQDKGQRGEVAAFCKLVRNGGEPLFSIIELATTTRATFRIVESLRSGRPLAVSTRGSDDSSA